MPFLPPNQQRQSTEGKALKAKVLGKLFTPIVPLFTKQRNWQQGL